MLTIAVLTASLIGVPSGASAATPGVVQGVVSVGAGQTLDGVVTVQLRYNANGPTFATAIPDPITGAYSISAPTRQYSLYFKYEGTGNYVSAWHGPAFGGGDGGGYGFVNVVDGTTTIRDYVVPLGGTVTGTILGGGVPVAKPSVRAYLKGSNYLSPDNTTRFTADASTGEYVLDRIQPGPYGFGMCGGAGWLCGVCPEAATTPGNYVAIAIGTTISNCDLNLTATNGISGTVTAAVGDGPQQYVDVMLRRLGEQYFYTSTKTAADGTYYFNTLAEGSYEVCFGSNYNDYFGFICWDDQPLATATVVEVAGSLVTGIDAVVGIAGSLTGTVVWDGPLAEPEVLYGAEITLFPAGVEIDYDDINLRKAYTDADGRFTFTSVQPGAYLVRVRWNAPEPWLNNEYWNDAWYIQASEPVDVPTDTVVDLGTIELTERSFAVGRITGTDRFGTAAAIAQEAFPGANPSVPVVYIANGLNYPDALAAGPAAIHQGGILLTVRPTALPPVIAAELRRLQPEKVVVVGGVAGVSTAVYEQIADIVGAENMVRLGGANRYETARAVIRYAFNDPSSVVYVATGTNYPDALSAGPAAAVFDAPVILVNGAANSIDAATAMLLDELDPNFIRVAGGTGSVSTGIEDSLAAYVLATGRSIYIQRFAGVNRYDTSNLLNEDAFLNSSSRDLDVAFVAVGTNFADALTGAALAGAWGSPLYLSPKDCLNPAVVDLMIERRSNVLALLGGTGVLGANVENFVFCQ